MQDDGEAAIPRAYYQCIENVLMRRGGDIIGISFTSGQVFPLLRFEGVSAVMLNDVGTEHLIPSKMLAQRFRKVENDDQTKP
jgi:hypothetical protein